MEAILGFLVALTLMLLLHLYLPKSTRDLLLQIGIKKNNHSNIITRSVEHQ